MGLAKGIIRTPQDRHMGPRSRPQRRASGDARLHSGSIGHRIYFGRRSWGPVRGPANIGIVVFLLEARLCTDVRSWAWHAVLERRRGNHSADTGRQLAAPRQKAPPETWVVVKIGDDFKAIRSTEVADRKEEKMADDYKKRRMADYKDARKSDPKAEKPVPDEVQDGEDGLQENGTRNTSTRWREQTDSKGDAKGDSKGDETSRPSRPRPLVAAECVPLSRIIHRVPFAAGR